MTNVRVIRRERFNAAHRLFNPNWSDKKNEQIFGKCANKNWHGHNYELFVTVEGPIDPDTGYVMDLKKLSDIIKHNVVDKMDHRNLNLEVDFMKGVITTAENIAVKIYEQIEKDIKSTTCSLHSVKLYETENNYVEYYG
ncbi:MAG: 6-carboxytetrahydropterin synthase [Bacteroidota bacterium]|nr:6-carboxytetrahydropterin synthase [Bacteroidota bacterium]MEE3037351.1 6-carboxytetrahydropterin synthase [Bacteroidota bacterium]